MKRIFLLLIVALSLTAANVPTHAQNRVGIGFIFGDPTGFSWRYKLDSDNALGGVLGFSPFDRFRFHVDYLWISRPFDEPNLSLSYGVGAAVGFGRAEYIEGRGRFLYITRDVSTGFGIRTVIGLNYMIPRSPVELGLEAAPIIIVAPRGGVGVDGGVAVRFYP
jgi:hypothetical protein